MSEVALRKPEAGRMGFFTDTTVCIGCKACEVACKQWNDLPADGAEFRKGGSYDHTGELNATTWRHVRFVELAQPLPVELPPLAALSDAGAGVTEDEMVDLVALAETPRMDTWLFMSDVC